MQPSYTFTAKIWKYTAKDPWFFVSLPQKYAKEIRELTTDLPRKGFGTVKVTACICNVTWQTSIFPDKKTGSYLMPVKKEIRSVLGVDEGRELVVKITLSEV